MKIPPRVNNKLSSIDQMFSRSFLLLTKIALQVFRRENKSSFILIILIAASFTNQIFSIITSMISIEAFTLIEKSEITQKLMWMFFYESLNTSLDSISKLLFLNFSVKIVGNIAYNNLKKTIHYSGNDKNLINEELKLFLDVGSLSLSKICNIVILQFVPSLTGIITALIFLRYKIYWHTILMFCIPYSLSIGLSVFILKIRLKYKTKCMTVWKSNYFFLQETLNNWDVIKANHMTDFILQKYYAKLQISRRYYRRYRELGILSKFLSRLSYISLSTIYVSYIVRDKSQISVFKSGLFKSTFDQLDKGVTNLILLTTKIKKHQTIVRSFEKFDNIFTRIVNLKNHTVTVTFKNAESSVLVEIFNTQNANTLTIYKGEKIAIIGNNGSGKTNFIRSLLGFHQSCYQITYFLTNVSRLNGGIENLHRIISYLPQKLSLFDTSIGSNIKFGQENTITDEQILVFCEKLDILSFIKESKMGLDSSVGQDGDLISIGEKQMILLARCLLKSADLYLLDEPTSSLDEKTSEGLFTHMKSQQEKSFLVAVHDYKYLKYFDSVWYLTKHGVKVFSTKDIKNINNQEPNIFFDMFSTIGSVDQK